jgi:hypothetical protein
MTPAIEILSEPVALAERLCGQRFVSAEFMYKPRPTEPRARRVFDFTLASRLSELSRYEDAAVLLICDSAETVASLFYLPSSYPRLSFLAALVNPPPVAPTSRDPYAETPLRCGWNNPAQWQRHMLTDRWSRIAFALEVGQPLAGQGSLIMPAHDAVWGNGLLEELERLSERAVQNGLHAATSAYTPHHHSAVQGVDIPPDIIDALNAAFGRDSLLHWRMQRGEYQAFWGKMGMIPFAMCAEILRRADMLVWEDDLEIDRVIREAGYDVRCLWADDPNLYRQALPVFDRAGLRAVIERTLHYSLSIPGDTSLLTRPLDALGQFRRQLDPPFAWGLALSEAITAECKAEIAQRLERYGASWVDWGAYRYVARVGDPVVQVWKTQSDML